MQTNLKKDQLLWLLETAGLAASIYVYKIASQQSASHEALLNFVKNSIIFNPSLLKRVLSQKATQSYISSINNLLETKQSISGIAFIQGIVSSKNSIKSFLNKSTDLVLSNLKTQPVYSNVNQDSRYNEKIYNRFLNEFDLTDANGDDKIAVVNSLDVQFKDALNFVASQKDVRTLSKAERQISLVLYTTKIFLSISSFGRKIFGFNIGTRQKEKGILINQYIVALGEFIYDKSDKSLRMYKPMYMLKDKAQQIKRLEDKKLGTQRNKIIWLFFSIVFGWLVVRRSMKLYFKAVEKFREMKEKKSNEKLDQIGEQLTDDFKCIACMERPKNVIIKPCMHLAICNICLKRLVDNNCPICKGMIEDIVKIYIS